MILVIDYGVGNLASFTKALSYLSLPFKVSSDPADLRGTRLAVLIGVGNFGGAMDELKSRGFDAAIREYVSAPSSRLFGICVGMQVLFEGSEEATGVEGLGLLRGTLQKLAPQPDAPVPHVGFDGIHFGAPAPMTAGLADGSAFYFTHSYALMDPPPGCWAAHCFHGARKFVAAVDSAKVGGVQFHPEKSQSNGITLLRNVCATAFDG